MKGILRHIVLIAAISGFQPAFSQQWSEEELNEKLNYGLKMGLGVSSMYGGELQNPSLYFGPVAGIYWMPGKYKKRYGFQTGLEARLRGSNFGNTSDDFPNSGNYNYRKIGLITLDLPLIANYKLNKSTDKRQEYFQIGLLTSITLRSTVYLGEDKIPARHVFDTLDQASSHLYRWPNLPLAPVELSGVIGYQTKGEVVGWQALLRFGINNLNQNKKFSMPYAFPATGTGRPIYTWSLEFAMLF